MQDHRQRTRQRKKRQVEPRLLGVGVGKCLQKRLSFRLLDVLCSTWLPRSNCLKGCLIAITVKSDFARLNWAIMSGQWRNHGAVYWISSRILHQYPVRESKSGEALITICKTPDAVRKLRDAIKQNDDQVGFCDWMCLINLCAACRVDERTRKLYNEKAPS